MQTDALILGGAAILFLAYGFMTRRGASNVDDTKLGWAQISAGLGMTYIGGAATIAMAGIGYGNGLIGLVDPISVLLGGLLVAVAIRTGTLSAAGEGVARFLAGGSRTRTLVYALCSLFVYTLLAAAQVVALSKIFSPYVGDFYSSTISIICLAAIAWYIYLGGIAAVTRADILQFFVILLLFVIPSIYGISQLIAADGQAPPIPQEPLDTRTVLLLSLSLPFVPLSQDIWVRVRRAKSATTARVGVALGVTIYFLVVGIAVLLGHMAAHEGIRVNDAESVLPYFFSSQLGLAGSVTAMVILVAVLSSLDAFTYNLNTTLTEDIWPKKLLSWQVQKRRAVSIMTVFVVCSLIALFANTVLDLVLVGLMAYVSVIAPGFVLGRFARHDITLWAPALLTLVVIVVCAASSIAIPYEPYSIIAGHFLVALFLLAVERWGAKEGALG